jgi:polysaccharide biosynthesis transport protein
MSNPYYSSYGGSASNDFEGSNDISRVLTIFRRYRFPIIYSIFAAMVCASIYVFQLQENLYTSEVQIQFDARKKQLVKIDQVLDSIPTDEAAIKSEVDIIASPYILEKVASSMHLERVDEFKVTNVPDSLNTKEQRDKYVYSRIVEKLLKRIVVDRQAKSNTVRIRFTSSSPSRAADIANGIADAFILYQWDRKYKATEQATATLNKKIVELKNAVSESDKAVQEFKAKHNLSVVDGGTVNEKQITELNKEIAQTNSELALSEAKLSQARAILKSRGKISPESIPEVLNSQTIQNLRIAETELLRERADLSTRYGPKHPKMQKINAEIYDLDAKANLEVRRILMGIENSVNIARSRQKSLEESLGRLEGTMKLGEADSVELAELERERDSNVTLYQSFLQRYKETSETQGQQSADALVVSRAEPSIAPSWPKKKFIFAGAFIIGLFAGLVYAFYKEFSYRGFRNPDHVSEITGVPSIGMMPELHTKLAVPEYVLNHLTSSYSEALRSVMTSVHFTNPENPPKSIMVTSSSPKEGKSTFSLSLARLMAASGSRVLLLDCDMRLPSIVKQLCPEVLEQVSEQPATLAKLLTGQCTFKDARRVDEKSGLHYVISTPDTPHSREILSSEMMQNFVKNMTSIYNYVIIDSPPVMALSDALMITKAVDTTIFLTRWENTQREVCISAIKQLTHSGAKMAGIVLNRVDLTRYERFDYGDIGQYHSDYRDYYKD